MFVREDGETATDSALLVGNHHRLDRRDQFATIVAFAIWLISLALEAPRRQERTPKQPGFPRAVLFGPARFPAAVGVEPVGKEALPRA